MFTPDTCHFLVPNFVASFAPPPLCMMAAFVSSGLLATAPSRTNQQIVDQFAVAGVSTNIDIICDVGSQDETPLWYINGSVYELFSIPRSFHPEVTPALIPVPVIPIVDSYTTLQLPVVFKELTWTTFQCAVFRRNGKVLGVFTRLNVQGESELINRLCTVSRLT